MIKLTGKHIVVTGASAGIGAELCRQLGREGCRVVLSARREAQLAEVADAVRAAGGEAHVVTCDVTERENIFALAEAAREHFGEIDIWVSNAGAGVRHHILDATEEDMLHSFKLNCLSSLWAYQAVAPGWIAAKHNGQFIDIASVASKSGFALGAGYGAAKHGLSAIGDVARQELSTQGITITSVYPGLTTSDFHNALQDRMPEDSESVMAERKKAWRGSLLVRKVMEYQSAEYVVGEIVKAMRTRVPTVYPHRWAAFACLLLNFWPGAMLKQMKKRSKP